MSGVDGSTWAVIDGFDHVQQSLETIITTHQSERVMREWFGNPGLRLLGENATQGTILLWFTIVYALVELFEPRFKITDFVVEDINRLGFAAFTMNGDHRPYAHLNWSQASAYVSVRDGQVTINQA